MPVIPAAVIHHIRLFIPKDLGFACPTCNVWVGSNSVVYHYPGPPSRTVSYSNVPAACVQCYVLICPECSSCSRACHKCGSYMGGGKLDLNRFYRAADCFADRDVLARLVVAQDPTYAQMYRGEWSTQEQKTRMASKDVTKPGAKFIMYHRANSDRMVHHFGDERFEAN